MDGGLILNTVIAGVIVLLLGAIGGSAWVHRGKPCKWGRAKKHARDDRIGRAKHAELVGFVQQRAEVIKKNVPVEVSGYHPVTVKWFPSGHQSYHVASQESRVALARQGLNPLKIHLSEPPRPIDKWSKQELRDWLNANK